MTTTTTTRTEYGFHLEGTGYRHGGMNVWPDENGKVRPYGNRHYRGEGALPDGVEATDPEVMRAAAVAYLEARTTIDRRQRTVEVISREVTITTTVVASRSATVTVVPAPVVLPTTPGSVVRASIRSGAPALWTLTTDTDSQPWQRVDRSHSWRNWAGPAELKDVEVLLDVATA